MSSEKFRINTNGQSLRNPSNGFFGMTLSPNLTENENDATANNDRRSAHNALERQRREHLNSKFQQLAHALPSLQSVRRPSKTMIVAKSLEYVASSLKRESSFESEIKKLREENAILKKQAEEASRLLKEEESFKLEEDKPESDKPIEEEKTTSKRKADDDESSIISTPKETPLSESSGRLVVACDTIRPKKKRMVKQTNSTSSNKNNLKTNGLSTSLAMPIASWIAMNPLPSYSVHSQTLDSTTSPVNYYDTNNNNMHYNENQLDNNSSMLFLAANSAHSFNSAEHLVPTSSSSTTSTSTTISKSQNNHIPTATINDKLDENTPATGENPTPNSLMSSALYTSYYIPSSEAPHNYSFISFDNNTLHQSQPNNHSPFYL